MRRSVAAGRGAGVVSHVLGKQSAWRGWAERRCACAYVRAACEIAVVYMRRGGGDPRAAAAGGGPGLKKRLCDARKRVPNLRSAAPGTGGLLARRNRAWLLLIILSSMLRDSPRTGRSENALETAPKSARGRTQLPANVLWQNGRHSGENNQRGVGAGAAAVHHCDWRARVEQVLVQSADCVRGVQHGCAVSHIFLSAASPPSASLWRRSRVCHLTSHLNRE